MVNEDDNGPLAQLVEQRTFNAWVASSNLARSTRIHAYWCELEFTPIVYRIGQQVLNL